MTHSDPFDDRVILPESAIPLHYDLWLQPDLTTFTFSGRADIRVKIVKYTNDFWVNVNEVTIQSASLTPVGNDKDKQSATNFDYNRQREEVKITFGKALTVSSEAILSVAFTGVISEKLAGFYRSAYTDKNGEKKYMAVTQFEATDARRAFPCWDEPNKKAKFRVTLSVEEKYVALSNMNVEKTRPSDRVGYKDVTYAESPLMSTYLVAFIVGELAYLETHTKLGNIPVRVYAPVGYEQQGKFAVDVGAKVLDFFTEYFDQPYPLPKMDMVAIPDFGSGAMENWGLVTYRMMYLLFDEKSSSLKTKQQVTYVVGHELAHQWFGNLVTMEWWSDLWLNEGFATWVGWLASDFLFPEWKIWTEFVVDDLQAGLSLDGLRSSHPIEVPVKNPSEISQIFDAISYSKGASVIRMLEAYLGQKTFQQGLRSYLKTHTYSNARTKDLWQALEKASGKPVEKIMTGWTKEVGYPILSVREYQGHDSPLTLKVQQNRFLASGDMEDDEDQVVWHVPLFILSSHADKVAQVSNDSLVVKAGAFNLSSKAPVDFYKVNGHQLGFFRVQYPAERLPSLGKAVAKGILSESDRLGLLNDAFSLGSAGYNSSTAALDLLLYYNKEEDYFVSNEIAGQLGKVKSVYWEQEMKYRSMLEKYMASLFVRFVKRLGWEYPKGEDDKLALLRTLAISTVGKNGHEEVIQEAQARFRDFIAGDEKRIHPDLRGTVFAIVVKHGGEKEWNDVFKIYESTNVADQKVAALSALGSTRETALIQKTLQLSLSESIRPQDVLYVYRSTAVNAAARRPTWEFVKTHWSDLYARYYKGSLSLLSNIVSSSTSYLTSVEDANDVESFFKGRKEDIEAITRTISQSLEKVRTSAAWLRRDVDAINKWLETHAG